MDTFLFILVVVVVIGFIAGPIIFLHSRKLLREQKNYERGLKMVPILIHLPPPSDDKDSGGRDDRELIDENISKAQIMYGIIASVFKKGLKSKFYGQRHFAFEIVGVKGFVKFYTAVPVAIVDTVKQAIISSYPNARLEEVSEHNIFSPIGKIAATTGGELTLKENYAYPIATYQDIKRDPIQSLLNALADLGDEDGVGIQILLRPANPGWRKKASEEASKKRKGKGSKSASDNAFWWIKQIFVSLWKPPDDQSGKDGSSPDKPELSSMEQTLLDSIDDKTRHPGFETSIRIIASSNISHKAQSILNQVVASFSLYDAPGKNGFKWTPAKDMDSFITAYILRFFPPSNNKNILNSVELAGMFHFPDQKNIPTSQLERQMSKQVDGPRNIPDEGLMLGYNEFRGVKKPIRIAKKDRQRHIYAAGQTGTGKSTFLENLAVQDMINGDGFAFVDPHGDSAENILARVPKERTEDIIYFCPSDMDYPLGLNMFEFFTEEQKDFLIQESLSMLYKLYDPNKQGFIGARFERIFTNCALLLMADPSGGTFIDIPKLLIDADFMKEKLQYVTDQNVLDFWTKEWPNAQRSNDAGEVTSWVVSKFGAFLSNEMMRNIIGQIKSSFNLREIMDNKKILIVNLSKGKTGDLNSKLLGMIFVMKFQAAAMSRADTPENERVDFCLYVDEFQNFSTDSFATILSEARKYRLNLIVANQFTTQLTDEIRDAVFGNVGTVVAFRIGQNDVETLSRYFQPLFDGDDLLRVPNYNTIVRTLIGGVPTNPFSMATLPPLGDPNSKLSAALKQLSAAKYGRPKARVEAEIFERLATKEPTKDSKASPFGPAPASATNRGVSASAGKPASGGSFLDEWLAKKKSQTKTSPGTGAATSASLSTPSAPALNQRQGLSPPKSPQQFTSATQAQASNSMALPKADKAATEPVNLMNNKEDPQKVAAATQLKPSGQASVQSTSMLGINNTTNLKEPARQQEATTLPVIDSADISSNSAVSANTEPPEVPGLPRKTSGEVDLSKLGNHHEISIDNDGNFNITD